MSIFANVSCVRGDKHSINSCRLTKTRYPIPGTNIDQIAIYTERLMTPKDDTFSSYFGYMSTVTTFTLTEKSLSPQLSKKSTKKLTKIKLVIIFLHSEVAIPVIN